MDECVPLLMSYGKDQIVAVAACMNMWRTTWEEEHPEGADDPGPDRPTDEEGSDRPMRRRMLALLKAYNEAEHPRDEHGRWTDGGGSDDSPTPSPPSPKPATIATARGIKGLPKDIVIKDHLVAQAQERGVWDMTATEKPKGDFDGSRRQSYRLTIASNIPEGIEKFEYKPEYKAETYTNPPREAYYNPQLANLVVHDADEPLLKATIAQPKPGLSTDITPLPGNDIMYRGMRAEEYENFLATGEIKSRGDYNLGDAQIGVTSWSSDVDTAAYYANGFAPWPHKATFEKPAYVVAAKIPAQEHIREVAGTGENEFNVTRAITPADVVAVFRGDVFEHSPGHQDIRPTSYDKNESTYEAGGGTSPSSRVVWQNVESENNGKHPGKGYSKNAKLIDGVIHTTSVYDAQRALHEDRPVELDQPRTVSVLLDKLGMVTQDMIEKGEKAPTFNLCRVTIKGTSLFCADTHGIPRVQMPQIAEGQEEPFRDFLAAKGYKIEQQDEHASYLRATQNELNGAKVARMATSIQRDGKLRGGNPIFTSRDNYILDGHHRWAAEVGVDAANNVLADSKKMAIWRVDASITQLLVEADLFTEGKGKLSVEDERRRRLLMFLLRRFDPAQERDEYGRWTDGGGSDAPSGGYTDEQIAVAMSAALVKPMAEATATKLDFNPELIEYSDEDKAFTVGDATYKYAGSYTFGSNKITLYKPHLGASNVRGVTAHEIGHRKFDLLLKARLVEAAAVMKEPGPPPDPDHRYWWGRKGGSDAVMKPDGTLREPYDKKYPLYEEWTQIQNMRPSLEQDDGITDYSKAYWKEWEAGKLNTDIAYHETMAEIARAQAIGGKHAKGTGKGWQRLFALQEKVWAETDKVERDTPRGPLKAIWVLDGVRWEIR
jgi:hypothetical protein